MSNVKSTSLYKISKLNTKTHLLEFKISVKLLVRKPSNPHIYDNRTTITKQPSLNLLKMKALNALLSVVILLFQKLISKKDVNPIISQPNTKTNQLEAHKRVIIERTKDFKKIINKIILGSFLI
jgi:hypothetical protein